MEHPLKHFRTNHELGTADIAARVKVSRQTIHRIEKWEQTPSLDLVAKLIGITNGELSADDFLPKKRRRAA